VRLSALAFLIAVSTTSTLALAGPGKGKAEPATANNSCVLKHGSETTSCIVHINLPTVMLKTVQQACTNQGKKFQAEWRADGTCPKEGLIGTCNSGDESAYHMQTANYKWTEAKLTNVAQLKMMCEGGGGKWINP
jgi:hypothetical protein